MADEKRKEVALPEDSADRGQEPPPAYDDSSAAGPSSGPSHATTTPSQQPGEGPTPKNPFNFPPSDGLPSYTESSSSSPFTKPIAIPQSRPDPAAAPFVPAYAPALLARGITQETWHAFVTTTSAFLTATVSSKALAHAGDVARHLGAPPASFGRNVARNAKTVSSHVRDEAKKGNVVGAAFGAVGGAVSLTLGTVFGAVGAATAMPATAIGAVARKPKTPRERAAAYVVVANRDWLNARGLRASVLDTGELCRAVAVDDARELLEEAGRGKDGGAAGQLRRLGRYFCELEVGRAETLELGPKTLWLVVNQLPS